uniref:J domain-containing protein n=1 Tax=Parascaris equorum TaxID=6256 RepID=A0A914S0S6_PAREQ
THYEVLGVRRDASLKEIKNAFYTLSKKVRSLTWCSLFELLMKYHPDVAGSSVSSASTTNFMVIKDAYDVLRDPEKRLTCVRDYCARVFIFILKVHGIPTDVDFPVKEPRVHILREFMYFSPRLVPARSSQSSEAQPWNSGKKPFENDLNKHFDVEFHENVTAEQFSEHENNDCQYCDSTTSVLETRGIASMKSDECTTHHRHTRFDFTNDFAHNFELLNKILSIYLVVFFAVAITSGIYQRM